MRNMKEAQYTTRTGIRLDMSRSLDMYRSSFLTWISDGLTVCALRMMTERMDLPSSESNRALTGDLEIRRGCRMPLRKCALSTLYPYWPRVVVPCQR